MPLPMVHLCVAKEYARYNALVEQCADFFLGSIAPDAIHMRENSTRADKDITHVMVNGKIYIDNVIEFMRKGKSEPNHYFRLGYVIHILTDYFWHESIMKSFVQRYSDNHDLNHTRKDTYYNDADSIDLELYDTVDWRSDVWDMLRVARICSIEELLSNEEVFRWNNRTLSWYDMFVRSNLKPNRYISYYEVLEFNKETGRRISELFEAEGII